MTIDDRMQTAFKNRIHSLETTMTTQTPNPQAVQPPADSGFFGTGFLGSFGPWIATGAAAVALLVGGTYLLTNDGDNTTIIADQPTTVVSPTPTTAAPTGENEPTPTTAVVTETTAEPATTVPSPTQTTAAKNATCSATGYQVEVPAGWFHDGCAVFSPAAIPAPGPFEFRPEIDLSYTTSETYAQALNRINTTMTVGYVATSTVDGLDATIYTLEEEWFETGFRTVYVVDAGNGVFFASGNELVDSGATVTDLDAHYALTLSALGDMMATVDITYVAPKQAPACGAPSLSNPSTGPSIQADIDGDGSVDTVDLVHHDNGVSIVVDAGVNGFYTGTFAFSDPVHVSNQVIAVDLDANGTQEILGSAASGPAGNNFEAFRLSGCDLLPIGGAQPMLVQRASVTNVASFECNFGAHGPVQLDTMASVYDNATAEFNNEGFTYTFDGTNWIQVANSTSTTPNPLGLSGPSTCI